MLKLSSSFKREKSRYEYLVKERSLGTSTYLCAKMIQSIEINSSLLTTISPAMFLHIIATLGRSKCFESASNEDRGHVSLLVLQYLESVEDQLYFSALSGAFGLVLFSDDTELSGELALMWFTLMKRKGWEDEWITFVCTSFLERYLTYRLDRPEHHLHLTKRAMQEVPADIAAVLFSWASSFKGLSPAIITGLRYKVYKVIRVFQERAGLVLDEGRGTHHWDYSDGDEVVKILDQVDPTDTIRQLKIHIARQLGLMSSSWSMTLAYDDTEMDDDRTIAFYKVVKDRRRRNDINVTVFANRVQREEMERLDKERRHQVSFPDDG